MSNLITVFCPKGELFELPPTIAQRMVSVLGWTYEDSTIKTVEPKLEDLLSVLTSDQLRKKANDDFGAFLSKKMSKQLMIKELVKLQSMAEGNSDITREESKDDS